MQTASTHRRRIPRRGPEIPEHVDAVLSLQEHVPVRSNKNRTTLRNVSVFNAPKIRDGVVLWTVVLEVGFEMAVEGALLVFGWLETQEAELIRIQCGSVYWRKGRRR
jgi:hypothetical protein